jgi:hypothetical protein
MTKLRRVAMVTSLIMVAPSVIAVHDALDARPVCARSKDWVAQHVSSLPSTLEQLRAYPAAYRKTILGTMTSDARAALWRQHLEQWSHAPTPAQREVIARAIAFITPAVIASPETNRSEAIEIAKAGRQAFGDAVAKEIFEVIGGTESRPLGSLAALRIYIGDSLRNAFTLKASSNFCLAHCSSFDNWCRSPYHCVWIDEQWCDHTEFGCGSFGLFPCDGTCELNGGGGDDTSAGRNP